MRLHPSRQHGFTLIELLVVVGILALIVGLAIPMLVNALRNSDRARAKADLNAIALALEAYKQDFADYPRPIYATPVDDRRGARVLARALLGPGSAAVDGADGLGFRTRGGAARSQVYGPYLRPENFKTRYAAADGSDAELLDRTGAPIAYFVAASPKPNIRTAPPTGQPAPFVDANNGQVRTLYNFTDNAGLFSPTDLARFRFAMGDRNNNGYIDGPETPAWEGEFLLWFRGDDTEWGPAAATEAALRNMDDVTSFSN
jgi:prepilin-type N-terminal cleavage/methylation domain-containing protein